MISIFTGENSFALRAELRRIIDDFTSEHSEMGMERLDGEEVAYDRMLDALNVLPFLSKRRLVVLYKPSANKEFVENIDSVFSTIPETTDVIVVEPSPDKRTSYYKTLKKRGKVSEFHELDVNKLSNWLVDRASKQNSRLSYANARYLVQRAGVNQQLLSNELDKLLNFSNEITRQEIDLLVEPTLQSTIFQLLDAALEGKLKRAIELYDEQRAMRVEPLKILAMLARQLRVLAIIKTAIGKDTKTITKESGLDPFVVRKTQVIARRMSLSRINYLTSKLLELNLSIKSQAVDTDDCLRSFLIEITNTKQHYKS